MVAIMADQWSGKKDGSGEDVHAMLDGSAYTLTELQRLIVQFGPKHFSSPLIYFQALLLTRQYERAIAYLYVYERVDAVHYAIALHPLLKTSGSMVCSIVPSLSAEEDNSGSVEQGGGCVCPVICKDDAEVCTTSAIH